MKGQKPTVSANSQSPRKPEAATRIRWPMFHQALTVDSELTSPNPNSINAYAVIDFTTLSVQADIR